MDELNKIRKQKNELYSQLLVAIKEETIKDNEKEETIKDNEKKDLNILIGGYGHILSLKEALNNSILLNKK